METLDAHLVTTVTDIVGHRGRGGGGGIQIRRRRNDDPLKQREESGDHEQSRSPHKHTCANTAQ